MRFRRLASLVTVAVLFCAAPAAASDHPAPLPNGVSLHVAVRSPKALIESADQFAAAVTKGTPNTLQPGMLTMLAFMQLPLSPDVWDMESALHFVMPTEFDESESFLIFDVGPFDEFVKKLADEVEVEKADSPSSRLVELRGLGTCIVSDLGDGKVVLARSRVDTARTGLILENWRPEVWGKGDIMIDLNLPEGWEEETDFYEGIAGALEELYENGMPDLDEAAESGINPRVLRNCVRLFYRYAPFLLEEMATIHGFAFDISLTGERAGLMVQGKFDDYSLLTEMAEAATENGPADSMLARCVGKDAAAIAIAAPIWHIIPNAQNRLYWFMGDILTTLYPDQAEEFLKHFLVATSDDQAETVTATYVTDDSYYSASWQGSHAVDELMDATVGAIEAINGMIDATLVNKDYKFRLAVSDAATPEGDAYKVVRLVGDNPEKIDELIEEAGRMDPTIAANLATLKNFHVFFAAKDDTLVVVGNTDNPERMAEALAALDSEEEEDAFAARPAVVESAQVLSAVQHSFAVADADAISILFLQALLEATGDEMAAVFKPVVARAREEMRKSGDAIGMGFGAANGRLALELGFTAKTVNAIVYNYGKFKNILAEEIGKAESGAEEDAEEKAEEKNAEKAE